MEQTEQSESGIVNRRLTAMKALLPSVPEIRYLLSRMLFTPPMVPIFVTTWSLWRRRVAKLETLEFTATFAKDEAFTGRL